MLSTRIICPVTSRYELHSTRVLNLLYLFMMRENECIKHLVLASHSEIRKVERDEKKDHM